MFSDESILLKTYTYVRTKKTPKRYKSLHGPTCFEIYRVEMIDCREADCMIETRRKLNKSNT